jgi:putative ABC transport system substrate-binding protein
MVDVIVAGGLPPALVVNSATSIIPIVFASVSDPVAAGQLASLVRPGNSLTGFGVLKVETHAQAD